MNIRVQEFAKSLMTHMYQGSCEQPSTDASVRLTIPATVDASTIKPTLKEIGTALGMASILPTYSYGINGASPDWIWDVCDVFDGFENTENEGIVFRFEGSDRYELQMEDTEGLSKRVKEFQPRIAEYLNTQVDVEINDGVTTVILRDEKNLDLEDPNAVTLPTFPLPVSSLTDRYNELENLCSNLKGRAKLLLKTRALAPGHQRSRALERAAEVIETTRKIDQEARDMVNRIEKQGIEHEVALALLQEIDDFLSSRPVADWSAGDGYFEVAEDMVLKSLDCYVNAIAAQAMAEVQTAYRRKYPG